MKDVKDVLCGRLGVPSAQQVRCCCVHATVPPHAVRCSPLARLLLSCIGAAARLNRRPELTCCVARQHLYFRGTELPNKRSLWEAWVEEGSTVLLVVDDGTGDGGALASFDVRPCMAVRARYRRLPRLINQVRAGFASPSVLLWSPVPASALTPQLRALSLFQCRLALARGVKPKLAEDGEGGTYFMPGPGRGWRNKYVLCFKPNDEEPFGPQNPKTFVGKLGQVRACAVAAASTHRPRCYGDGRSGDRGVCACAVTCGSVG